MKKVFFIIPIILMLFTACSEESAEIAELSAEYGIPIEVLKSNEFKDFMSAIAEATKADAKLQDEFFKITSSNSEKMEMLKEVVDESQKKQLSMKEVDQQYKTKVGVSPFDVEMHNVVKTKREVFFKKFPEYEKNLEKFEPIEKYFKKEVIDYDNFMAEREANIFNNEND